MKRARLFLAATLAVALGCGPELGDPLELYGSALSAAQRRTRAEAIRDTARARGLDNGALLAGIGDAETGLAHCWSEATWACQGPHSASCGGPVIAGAGDGPCAQRQGGLGLFQFDGGTYDQTLARDGAEVLQLEGNISHAVDFVLAMVVRSQFIEGVDDEAQALAFMNAVPITPGDARYESWVSTVTRYYNGCSPSSSCWDTRRGRYGGLTVGVYDELGADFWGRVDPPPSPCAAVPPEGRVIEETESCYRDGGASSGWRRVGDAGSGGALSWTYATAGAEDNFGVWQFELTEAGVYRVEVASDGGSYAQSRRARYTLVHDGVSEDRILDQSSASGFLPLAEVAFAAGGGQSLRLSDATGEPYADRVRLVFDAVRLVRVDVVPMEPTEPPPEPVDTGEPLPDVEVPMADVGTPVVAPELSAPPVVGAIEGGCQCVAGGGSRAASGMVWLIGGVLLGRRRGRRR